MQNLTVTEGTALKEWAAVIAALEKGEQIVLFRKGGIHEDGFDTKHNGFYLYPTGFHQDAEKLKDNFIGLVDEVKKSFEDVPKDNIRISSIAEIVETIEVKTPAEIEKLSDHHVFKDEAINKRYTTGSGVSMNVLIIRVYRLPIPVILPVIDEYGGCVSWINLKEEISTEGANPVLSDDIFLEKQSTIRSILG